MEIHVDPCVSQSAVPRVQQTVLRALGKQPRPEVRVYVSCPRPGRWSVFISGLVEHPLAVSELIEKTLADQDVWPSPIPAGPHDPEPGGA